MNHDTENYIISTWLMGEHLNDLNIFQPGDFSQGNNPDIVRMLQNGMSSLEILRKYADDYRILIDSYLPSVYAAALNEAIEAARWRWIKSGASLPEVMKIFQILNDRQNGISAAPVIQRDLLATWERTKAELRSDGQVEYGIETLDDLTGGIYPGHLTTLAGRPGEGKSTLALQIASHVALQERRKVIFFTLEMGITEQLDRLLAQRVGVQDQGRLKRGELNLPEMAAFRNEIETIQRGQLLLFSIERTIERIEKTIIDESPFLIVIDQLTQLQFASRTFPSDLERYKAITRHLKMLTNTTGVTILLLCQLNRTAAGKEPELYQLKDSGSIEEDSDNVLMIYKPPGERQYEVPNSSAPSFRYLKIAKQRSGTTAIIPNLTFDPVTMTINKYRSALEGSF